MQHKTMFGGYMQFIEYGAVKFRETKPNDQPPCAVRDMQGRHDVFHPILGLDRHISTLPKVLPNHQEAT